MTEKHSISIDVIQEYSKCWSKLMNKIEHDAFNKLATIRMTNKSLQEIIPILFKAYQIALEHNIIENEIHPNDIIDYKDNNASDMESVLVPLFDFYDAVHAFIKEIVTPHKYPTLSAKDSVTSAIDTYPFKNNCRNNVTLNAEHDFSFSFSDLFMKALFKTCFDIAFDTLNNGCAGKSNNPENTKIEINFSNDTQVNTICILITNVSITENDKNCMDSSLVVENNAISPSLNLCRLALINIGGALDCQITPGKEMKFMISFPKS